MPRYNKKITQQMTFTEFESKIPDDLKEPRKAFLYVLFFSGCRVSEALALTRNNISCTTNTIYVEFHRLKGSKQTDPIELPNIEPLSWVCGQFGKLFPWSRMTGYRIVNRVFTGYYPHFFRQNRVTDTLEKFGIPTTKSFTGLTLPALEHYVSKVEIKRVGEALRKEANV